VAGRKPEASETQASQSVTSRRQHAESPTPQLGIEMRGLGRPNIVVHQHIANREFGFEMRLTVTEKRFRRSQRQSDRVTVGPNGDLIDVESLTK
jgi:hypothetical protein